MSDGSSVLIITGSYPPRNCGIADYTRGVATALHANGVKVTVLTPQAPAEASLPVLTSSPITNLAAVRLAVRLVRRLRPDIVHLQYQTGIYENKASICFLPLMLKLCSRARVVTTLHDLNGPPAWGKAGKLGTLLVLASSNAAIVCSSKQHACLKRLPVVGRRVSQVPVGPGVTVISGEARPESTPHGAINILYFGFIWRDRGLESIITACAAAARAGYSIKVTLAGGIIDAEHADELRRQAGDSGLGGDQIRFTGAIPAEEISRMMRDSHFCILPFPTGVSTGRSTFSSCVVHGLPVITTYDQANCPAGLQHGENVLLYEYGDDERLCELVIQLCADPTLREKLGENMRSTMGYLDWPPIAAAHQQVYARLCKAHRATDT